MNFLSIYMNGIIIFPVATNVNMKSGIKSKSMVNIA